MAASLVCKQCDTLLAGVKEAQAHNEATGHSQFEESTQKVPRLVCAECGKVCRSDVEKAMHTRGTGHASYLDKTDEADVIDTERQMAEAKKEILEDLEADADLLGVQRKAKAAPAGGPGADAGGGVEAMAVDEEMVPAQVDAGMLGELTSMGFGEARAARALHQSGNSSVEGAVGWLTEHEADEGLDEPLLVPKSSIKPQLTAEEKRAKADEALRRAKERREREEREAEKERERNRIRHGKEILEAQRKEEEGRLRRVAEEREREKREEHAAREKLRVKLEEDRKERRRKLGLPEELTEEEKAAEAEKARQKAAQEVGRRTQYVKPVSLIEKLRAQLVAMKKAAPGGDEQFKAAASTLLRYLGNVARDPDEEKFRRINLGNAAFQSRVAVVPGAVGFLEAVGFKREADGSALYMPREAADAAALGAAGGEVNNALTNPFFGAL